MIKKLTNIFGKEITYSFSSRDTTRLHTRKIVGFSNDFTYVFLEADPTKYEPRKLQDYMNGDDFIIHDQDDTSILVTRTYVTGLVIINSEVADEFKQIQRKLLQKEADDLVRSKNDLLSKVKEYDQYIENHANECASMGLVGVVLENI